MRTVNHPDAAEHPRLIGIVSVWVPFVVSLAVPIGLVWVMLVALGWATAVVLRGRAGLPVAGLLSVLAVLANLILYAFVTTSSVSFG